MRTTIKPPERRIRSSVEESRPGPGRRGSPPPGREQHAEDDCDRPGLHLHARAAQASCLPCFPRLSRDRWRRTADSYGDARTWPDHVTRPITNHDTAVKKRSYSRAYDETP